MDTIFTIFEPLLDPYGISPYAFTRESLTLLYWKISKLANKEGVSFIHAFQYVVYWHSFSALNLYPFRSAAQK